MRRFITNAPVGFFPLIMLIFLLVLVACAEIIEDNSSTESTPPAPDPVRATPVSAETGETDNEPAPGYAEAIPPEDVPQGPDPADLLSVPHVEYERDGGNVSAVISLDTGGVNPEWGNELEVRWSDGETMMSAPERIILGKDIVEIPAQRSDAPESVTVDALFFERVTFDLAHDPEAMVHEDRIETRWGDFPILNIIEQDDGSGRVYYAAAGRRVIYRSSLDHHGTPINFATVAYARGEDLIPVELQLGFSTGFVEARPDLPLPAEIQVRELAGDVLVPVN